MECISGSESWDIKGTWQWHIYILEERNFLCFSNKERWQWEWYGLNGRKWNIVQNAFVFKRCLKCQRKKIFVCFSSWTRWKHFIFHICLTVAYEESTVLRQSQGRGSCSGSRQTWSQIFCCFCICYSFCVGLMEHVSAQEQQWQSGWVVGKSLGRDGRPRLSSQPHLIIVF